MVAQYLGSALGIQKYIDCVRESHTFIFQRHTNAKLVYLTRTRQGVKKHYRYIMEG